jgi:hypothetical protein
MPFVLCSLTAPADELAFIFTEQVELLSMFLTQHLMVHLLHLLDDFNYLSQISVVPEIVFSKSDPAQRTVKYI